MRRKGRFERLGYLFESIGRTVEGSASKNRDPVRFYTRRACKYLIVVAAIIGALVLASLFQESNPWTLLALGIDLAAIVVSVHAMRTPQPLRSFLWMSVASLLLVLTLIALGLLAKYA